MFYAIEHFIDISGYFSYLTALKFAFLQKGGEYEALSQKRKVIWIVGRVVGILIIRRRRIVIRIVIVSLIRIFHSTDTYLQDYYKQLSYYYINKGREGGFRNYRGNDEMNNTLSTMHSQ
jgi:hypothetical protein